MRSFSVFEITLELELIAVLQVRSKVLQIQVIKVAFSSCKGWLWRRFSTRGCCNQQVGRTAVGKCNQHQKDVHCRSYWRFQSQDVNFRQRPWFGRLNVRKFNCLKNYDIKLSFMNATIYWWFRNDWFTDDRVKMEYMQLTVIFPLKTRTTRLLSVYFDKFNMNWWKKLWM